MIQVLSYSDTALRVGGILVGAVVFYPFDKADVRDRLLRVLPSGPITAADVAAFEVGRLDETKLQHIYSPEELAFARHASRTKVAGIG